MESRQLARHARLFRYQQRLNTKKSRGMPTKNASILALMFSALTNLTQVFAKTSSADTESASSQAAKLAEERTDMHKFIFAIAVITVCAVGLKLLNMYYDQAMDEEFSHRVEQGKYSKR